MDYVFKSKEDLHTQHFFKFRNLWKSKDDFYKEENIFFDDFTVAFPLYILQLCGRFDYYRIFII